VAVTVVSALRVVEQAPLPAQPPPLQPDRPAEAVRLTVVPRSKGVEQVPVQPEMPAGLELTDPLPTTLTVSVGRLKFAVTATSDVSVRAQAPVPEQPPPDQPVKFETLSGWAVNVTCVPGA
jgi:hypothetical protein